jgi:hypothetical protein
MCLPLQEFEVLVTIIAQTAELFIQRGLRDKTSMRDTIST